ncbi:MAG: type IIA DNA topoisomerase subunit B [Verrucomicrobia bacterium]|nr:MAG: type IIA DNA topoisomerase subunit B [Verrucomicrobiota bacterium]TAE87122.1 MAG: type IIA DNA topoisomerase subunit B [Verrucomicrobiota bacterium]TAF24926.1 MAG: type IIA DNA topoisomerase subunit B [Verrucomicrobiota bacterium]TAF40747.1 MAG: type IIA DNA topoisomerase subunit B [Verrucomicrobiota bacterium]
MAAEYTEADIKSLDWREHIRMRPGMYIGKLGDGSSPDDGIYILLKEVIDNSIDEHIMGHGKEIRVDIDEEGRVEVRDFGRGIPLGKLFDCAAQINTGAKYDSEAFKKSVGLNGVGIKAVNALASFFEIQAWRDGQTKAIEFSKGVVTENMEATRREDAPSGTRLAFEVDRTIFPAKAKFKEATVERMCRYYSYLNPGLAIFFNGKKFKSKDGLLDLLREEMESEALYDPIHLKGADIEIAFTHTAESGEEYYTFVNGQNTTQGGTHLQAFREGLVNAVRGFYKKQYDPADIRAGIEAAVCVRIVEPVFESQTKTKLGSATITPNGESLRTFVGNFLKQHLDNYLHKHPKVAEAIQKRIQAAERERKDLKGIQKIARERAKQAKVHNKKLRDCRAHLGSKHKQRLDSTLFITEGDSASGSITKSRDVETQAVFSLRGKPLNTFGLAKKIVYENEEFALLQAALGIEDGIEELRYNRVVIATDADVDGMHIRLLLLTFFLQFFPEVIREGHLFILQTPLFRVRNKKETVYCYDEDSRVKAIAKLGKNAEITRFKGLGEISPDEFKFMIGPDMRLDPVTFEEGKGTKELLAFYMGKNTPDRQDFIIGNLRIEVDRQVA